MTASSSGKPNAAPHHLTVLIAGGRPDQARSNDSTWPDAFSALAATLTHLRYATDAFAAKHDTPCNLRLLSGNAPGAETFAAAFATENGLSLHRLLADTSPVSPTSSEGQDDRVVSLCAHVGSADNDFRAGKLASIRDEIALAFADMLVAVWDGSDCPEEGGGTVRLIHQAARQRKPVIWISPDGAVRVLPLADLSDALRHALGAYEADPALLARCFATASEPVYLSIIESVLAPWATAPADDAEARRLKALIDQERHRGKASPASPFTWWSGKAERLHKLVFALVSGNLKDIGEAWRHDSRHPYRGPVDPTVTGTALPVEQPDDLLNDFDHADVEANINGGRHRGSTWQIFGLAALAVLAAITGAVTTTTDWLHTAAPIAELLILALLLGVYALATRMNWHRTWVRRRFLAEQLRFVAMGYPLLVVMEPLRKPLWVIKQGQLALESAELWQLQRRVIEQGLPRATAGRAAYSPAEHLDTLADYVCQVIVDQRTYHQSVHRTNHHVHHRLHTLTVGLFALTLIGVVLHFTPLHPPGLLFLTAFLPALAASIHGALNMLEVERLGKQSGVTDEALAPLAEAIDRLMKDCAEHQTDPWLAWVRLRSLATEAAAIMSDENDLWAGILHNNQPFLG